jgi:hypothetical protein
MSKMITYATDKDCYLVYTTLNVQVVVDPLIEKINTTDLKTSQVTTLEVKVVVQFM